MFKLFLISLFFLITVDGFYLPGVAPVDFPVGAKVEIKANQLQSTKTQLPYGPYSLPFCVPDKIEGTAENLGEILRGDKIKNSPYKVYMKDETMKCEVLCEMKYKGGDRKKFTNMIDDEYTVNWIADNLPAATAEYYTDDNGKKIKEYKLGFPLGSRNDKDKNIRYINNHVSILMMYHDSPLASEDAEVTARLVGFEVKASSVKHVWDKNINPTKPITCTQLIAGAVLEPQQINSDHDVDVTWTYDVTWENRPDIEWASRWDTYLLVQDEKILWFSIVNSFMISLFLSGVVGMILLRTVHQDFARYNQLDATEDAQEETGWKLVHGDVFRPPVNPILFSVTVGVGSQIYCMVLATIIFAIFGFLSPANRGALLSAMVMTYMFFGIIAGKTAAKLYKSFIHHGIGQAPGWKRLTILTATLYPGIVFALIFFLNFFIWSKGSSAAIPFWALVLILLVWFGISAPSTAIGVYFGQREPEDELPVRTNQIPRQIPEQYWYQKTIPHILMGGIMPFAAIFIELYFIFTSIWQHQLFYAFGFLFLVFIIMTVMSAEIAIVLMYFQLCSEDYLWWWRSVLTPGSSAFYMFLYSISFYVSKSEIADGVSTLLFFTYTFIMCLVVFLMTGCVGYFGSMYFARAIFSSVKVD